MPIPIPNRSNDIPPPDNKTETYPCKCGAKMVGRIDRSAAHQGVLHWFWWCGGCDAVRDGGQWHPIQEPESALNRWKDANPDKPTA